MVISADLLKPEPTDDPDAPKKINRRRFLSAAASVAAVTAMAPAAFARNFDPDAEPVRYPEPDVIGLDPRFKYKNGNAPIQRLYKGTFWAEGPAWNAVGRYLLWSDIPADEQLRWLEESGHVSRRFRYPSYNSNGNTFDYQGRQIACEHGTHSISRYGWDGKHTVLFDSYDGKPFNAPNDAVVNPNDGAIWFTDPGYGQLMNYEGVRANTGSGQPHQKEAVYRIDGHTGKLTKVTDEIFKPNGLCFSVDFKTMYIADTGASHYPEAKPDIKMWDVVDGKTLKNARQFAPMEMDGKWGFADGIRCDEDGNIWAGMGWVGDGFDGVHIFAPNGDRIGQIKMPEIISNICFAGTKRNYLMMTGSQSLYAVFVETTGAHNT